jgi:VanZ family protein
MQPEIRTYARFEHIVAFALFRALFAFAYPRRFVLVCCVVRFGAIMLELQTFTPDRHGTVIDAVDKLIGSAIGVSGAREILFFCLPRDVSR